MKTSTTLTIKETLQSKITLFLIILLLSVLSIQIVLAVPPVQTTFSDVGLQIAYPQYQYVPVSTNFTLYVRVFNVSSYLTGGKATCYLTLNNPLGVQVINKMLTAAGSDYSVFINELNFTSYGEHSFIIQCNTTSQTGFANGVFEVTHSGLELTVGKAIIDLGLIGLLSFFLTICIVLFMNYDENLLVKIGFLGAGYLFLIAISYVSWSIAEAYVIYNTFLVSFLRIIFLVLTIGFFPLVIGGFAYYFHLLFKVKEIQRLMSKGLSMDEAERRQGKKFK